MKKVYNAAIATLALCSVVLVVMDLCHVIDLAVKPYIYVDTAILLIFAADYAVRFYISDDKKNFFKQNIFDLIAILPFNSLFSMLRAFRFFRIMRLTKLAKLSRIVRAGAFVGVLRRKLSGILKTNGLIYVIYANVALIVCASVVMMLAEKMPLSDAVWWCIVTCTTVGYGDISPSTAVGRVVAVVLMLFGIALIGMLTGAITTYFTSYSDKKSDDELQEVIESMTDEQKTKLLEIAKILRK